MTDQAPHPRFWPLFFELFEALPRQGPGSRECTAAALALCRGLPSSPAVVDLGCGAGAQTLDLAELTGGSVVAIDNHAPFIDQLQRSIAGRGLAGRVRALVGDMADPGLPPASFDLAWSEGALYNIGIESALGACRRLLRPGGCLAFTDAVWLRDNPPAEIQAIFDQEYPAMGRAEDVTAMLERGGFQLLGRFTLPDEAWWIDFYTPMEQRIESMRQRYAQDPEALEIIDGLAGEPVMHRRFCAWYGYEFFVACLTPGC